ncbi:hypothetical protein JQ620_15775 [Bradyrhizobium sp. AUGA SZCCT0274]|uniref:hypothetical protein n=1 Tax=Bradyrhizobium sp. AUGA SZCCT0274 TaxID=2807670 RepID=UPI001BAC9388|nr:hypothetical protein [Bradyrhizobium sp. AUGA SZCCT0274]MBR1241588.1 hypothetical protein [Bradyrhizobium sp. AUGA SZCCT0274]
MSDDDFYYKMDRQRMLESARGAAQRGERLTRQDRAALLAVEAENTVKRILAKTRAKTSTSAAVSVAVVELVKEMLAISLVNAEKRDALAERIVELERRLADGNKLRVVGGNGT